MAQLHPLVKKVLFTETQLKNRISEMAIEIKDFYDQHEIAENTVVFVGLLKGCIPFLQEFSMQYQGNCEIEYMVISSFGGGTKAIGKPKITLDINTQAIMGRDVLVLDDIIDTGHTLKYVKEYLEIRGAKSVRVATMIDKPGGRQANVVAEWTGFTIENEFIIGFGLDYEERLRNLPYIATCDLEKLPTWKW